MATPRFTKPNHTIVLMGDITQSSVRIYLYLDRRRPTIHLGVSIGLDVQYPELAIQLKEQFNGVYSHEQEELMKQAVQEFANRYLELRAFL